MKKKTFTLVLLVVCIFNFKLYADGCRHLWSSDKVIPYRETYDVNKNHDSLIVDNFHFSFDEDLQGWTIIDADGDGHNWYHSSEAMTEHDVEPIISHTGTGHLLSESYCNVLEILTPDNYLVSPMKYHIRQGSILTLWASPLDEGWDFERFGIAVSTTDNLSDTSFVMVKEWTLDNPNKFADWELFSCDLSEYAGQDVWIAIRHYESSDVFAVCIDDVSLSINVTDVEEYHNTNIQVYPNPTKDYICVKANGLQQIDIINGIGQIIYSEQVDENNVYINISQHGRGMFFVRITTKDDLHIRKLHVVE